MSIPDCVAVHPNDPCVYSGIIKVDPYNPKPMINDRIVPTRRLPSFNTRNSTMGLGVVNSLQIKKKRADALVTVNRVMVGSLNQSSSCPRSSTY